MLMLMSWKKNVYKKIMLNYTEEKIKKAYDDSSPAIKAILGDTWIPESSQLIGKKLNIRIDKVGLLIKIIGFVLLDLIPISKFTAVVESEFGLSKSNAEDVAKEVDEHIFIKVRMKVREYKNNEEKKQEVEVKDNSLIKGMKDSGGEIISKNETIEVDPYREDLD